MKDYQKIAESLRHCAAGIGRMRSGHCHECLVYGEHHCIDLLKRKAADAIEQMLSEKEAGSGS